MKIKILFINNIKYQNLSNTNDLFRKILNFMKGGITHEAGFAVF